MRTESKKTPVGILDYFARDSEPLPEKRLRTAGATFSKNQTNALILKNKKSGRLEGPIPPLF